MKIRALKDMPFAKKGDIFENKIVGLGVWRISYHYSNKDNDLFLETGKDVFDRCIEEGWFEEVKEPISLADKMKNIFIPGTLSIRMADEIATIAREHALKIFDEAVNEYLNTYYNNSKQDVQATDFIRKKLEEGMR